MNPATCLGLAWLAAQSMGSLPPPAYSSTTHGNGIPGMEPRSGEGFTQVRAEGLYELELSASPGWAITVSGDTNLVPLVLTRVEGPTLFISVVGSYEEASHLMVKVAMPRLEAVSLADVVQAHILPFQGDLLRLELADAVSIHAESLQFNKLSASLKDASTLVMAGQATDLRIEVADKSTVNADFFSASSTATLLVGGMSQATLGGSRMLNGMVTDVATINYAGACESAALMQVTDRATFRCLGR